MRKLLLASAAMLGATAGGAYAQAPAAAAAPSQGQYAAPWAAGPAANNNNNYLGTAAPGANAVPTPGTVVVRMNGRVEVDFGAGWTTGDKNTATITTLSINPTTLAVTATGKAASYKSNPVNMASYFRLYPGVDGLSTNGIRYGASVELRENFGLNAGSPSAYSSSETMFVRRAFTYLGTDQVGIVRIGQADGVIGIFDNGTFTSAGWDAGVGNLNGGGMQAWLPQNAIPPYVWLSQAGAEYSNNKIVYLSPQFFGVDFAVQYAPNMGNSNTNGATPFAISPTLTTATNCTSALQTCASVTSGTDTTRWYNQVAVGARYQGSFSGVGVKAFAMYETAGKESSGVAGGAVNPSLTGSAANFKYDNLSFVNAGLAVDFMGITLASDYIGGAVNGQLGMRPTGGASMNAVVSGIVYKNGPVVLGANLGVINSQGDARLTGVTQRHELETSMGGTYTLAPGLALVGEYMYTQRHQGGFDFVTGTVGAGTTATAAGATRDAKSQGILVSTVVTW